MTEHPDPARFGDNIFPIRHPAPPAVPAPPPVSVETEQGLIGCILMQPHVYPLVQHLVSAEHFCEESHQVIWKVIGALVDAGETPNLIRVKSALGPVNTAFDLGGGLSVMEYLIRLTGVLCTPVSAPEYARVIQQYWALRELAVATRDIQEGTAFVPATALGRIYGRIDEIRASFVARKVSTATLDEAGQELNERIQAELRGEARPLPTTGITAFDREIGGGCRPSFLLTAAGRTSMGKSIFGVEVACGVVSVGLPPPEASPGFAAIYHSLEMSREQVAARIVASKLERGGTRLPFEQILRRGGLNAREAEAVLGAHYDVKRAPLTIEDGGGRTIGEIAVATDRIANSYARRGIPLGIVVIDHAHIVRPSRAFKREDEGLKEITSGALALAKHLDCTVVLLAQCNRGPEGREDKRPGLADIRGAGAFEEDSDAVVFLYRPAYYIERSPAYRAREPEALDAWDLRKNDLELILDKNRAGRSNQVIHAWIDPALNAIRNLQQPWS